MPRIDTAITRQAHNPWLGKSRPRDGAVLVRALPFCWFAIALLCIAYIFIHFGRIGWPGLHWDAALYGTPVLNVARGKGWIFGSYGPNITQRDGLAFDYHGILHVFAYGVILKAATWSRYLLLQGIINALTFSVYSAVYAYLLTRDYGARFRVLAAALLLGSVAGVLCLGLQGRPEHLVPLILCLPLAAFLLVSNRFHQTIMLGISAGILITASPLIGIFFSVLLAFYWLGTNAGGALDYLRNLLLGAFSTLATSLLLLALLTPFSPLEWYLKVFGSSQATVSFEGLLLSFKSNIWGYSLIAPWWNIISIALMIIATAWLWHAKRSFLAMALLPIPLILFNEKMSDYSYVPLLPFSLALCLCNSREIFSLQLGRTDRRVIQLLALIASASYLFILFSYFTASFLLPNSEVSVLDAQSLFKNSLAGREYQAGHSAVAFPGNTSPSLVVLGDGGVGFASQDLLFSPNHSDTSLQGYEQRVGKKVNWFIYPQVRTRYYTTPPANIYLGPVQFSLVENHWAKPNKADYRFKPEWLTNRYNFAIYRRRP
jgi:hypothetical protein